MSETQTLTRNDRVLGFALLGLSIVAMLSPRLNFAGQSLLPMLASLPWLGAALALLTNEAARKSVQWARGGALFLFVIGLASPFLANALNQFLGA